MKFVKNIFFNIKKWIKREVNILKMKYYPCCIYILKYVKATIFWTVIILSWYFLMRKLGYINIDNGSIYLDLFILETEEIDIFSILSTQISVVFVCISFISIIDSMQNKYIMGEPASGFAFRERGFFSFKTFLIGIFFLLFTNVYLAFAIKSVSAMLFVFIFSVYLIAIAVYKYSLIFLLKPQIEKEVFAEYYYKNIKHLKKATPLEHHIEAKVERYRNVVLMQIAKDDIEHYKENLEKYFSLLDYTFFNHRKLIQRYYTELGSDYDLISNIGEFCNKLLEKEQYIDSIYYYNRLYVKLNYYKIVNITNWFLSVLSQKYIEVIKNMKNESEIYNYLNYIFEMVDNCIYQVYVFKSENFDYCRLKKEQIHLFAYSNFYEKIYISIQENISIKAFEKNRIYEYLYDHIRMCEIKEKFPDRNYRYFAKDNLFSEQKEIFDLEIKGEPIALLFLAFFEKNDKDLVKKFLTMNDSKRLHNEIRILVVLSIINMLYLDNKRIFYTDIKIVEKNANKIIADLNMLRFDMEYDEYKNFYTEILNKYTEYNNEPAGYVKGSIYGFNPKFRYLKVVVDEFFYRVAQENGYINLFFEVNGIDNYITPNKMNLIMNRLQPKKN